MYTNLFLLLTILLFYSTLSNAQHDTTLEGHTTVVKEKKSIVIPAIQDSEFCKKLRSINESRKISFKDSSNDKELSYFLSLKITFRKGVVIPQVEWPRNRKLDSAVTPVIVELVQLLKFEKWKVVLKGQEISLYFDCLLTKGGLFGVMLSSIDGVSTERYCE